MAVELAVLHGAGLMPDPERHPAAQIVVNGDVFVRAVMPKSKRKFWILKEFLEGK